MSLFKKNAFVDLKRTKSNAVLARSPPWPVWPELAKFRHFDEILKDFGEFKGA